VQTFAFASFQLKRLNGVQALSWKNQVGVLRMEADNLEVQKSLAREQGTQQQEGSDETSLRQMIERLEQEVSERIRSEKALEMQLSRLQPIVEELEREKMALAVSARPDNGQAPASTLKLQGEVDKAKRALREAMVEVEVAQSEHQLLAEELNRAVCSAQKMYDAAMRSGAREAAEGGIGVKIEGSEVHGEGEAHVRIDAVLPGGPASGCPLIKANHILEAVAGTNLSMLSVEEARSLIVGPAGTPVTIKVGNNLLFSAQNLFLPPPQSPSPINFSSFQPPSRGRRRFLSPPLNRTQGRDPESGKAYIVTLLRSGGVAGDGLLDDNTRAACKKIQSIYKHVENLEAELSAAGSSSGNQLSAEMQVASVRQEAQSTLRREVERVREEARVEFIRAKDEKDLLEAECERLQDEIAAGSARCAGLERELAASSASTSMIKAELEALRGTVGDREAELEASGSKIAKMKQTVESQRKEIKQMELDREQLRSKLEVKERQATVLENQTKKGREQLDRCKAETALLKTEVAHLKEDLEEQREAVAKTGGEGKQAKGELQSLRRSSATFKSQVDEFRREAAARDSELSAMSAELAKVSSNLRSAKGERLELESEAQHIRVSLVFEG
jgi:hypothetical protein